MLPFALSIFTGAFLLFQVQPLIGKYILPWFGGSPGVWTTCLLFFQMLLLGGYAYAHFSTKYLKPRGQIVLHVALLLGSLALLPITPSETWKPFIAGDPSLRILCLLSVTIGLPYFVLSSTGPLMQRWFSLTHPGVSPYRLYALSNVGSLLALLSYPVFFEVKFTRSEQAALWSIGLGLFAVLCGWSAIRLLRQDPKNEANKAGLDTATAAEVPTHWGSKTLWITLPAIASVLLLAITNKLSQEVAVIPFLWVLPLALYLLSFVICFDHARWYNRGVFAALLVVGLASVVVLIEAGSDAPMKLQIVIYNTALFVACMICHGELYQIKPAPERLTSYFLFISAGGALGGLLIAVVAPAVFNDYLEFPLSLIVLGTIVALICIRQRSRSLALGAIAGSAITVLILPVLFSTLDGSDGIAFEYRKFFDIHLALLASGFAVAVVSVIDFRQRALAATWRPILVLPIVLLTVQFGYMITKQLRTADPVPVLRSSRNFYGTLKVLDYSRDNPAENYHLLMHGATTHGLQFTAPDRVSSITSYYGPTSGVGLAINQLSEKGPKRLGVVGLGTGSLAAYGAAGDYVRIYEINPAVERLARESFSYLARCPAKLDVIMGDARLMMERELALGKTQSLDLLALDAFSSDAIPVHLLTREAFGIYLKHLKPDGVIAIHISNRYLDLQPVVERLAQEFGLGVACISDEPIDEAWLYSTTWMLVSRDRSFLRAQKIAAATETTKSNHPKGILWTDDKTDLYSILK
ncbi:MAG: fused MFS/spermidine synthase [Opitutaceae bacterium]